jgi:hypothetical protein
MAEVLTMNVKLGVEPTVSETGTTAVAPAPFTVTVMPYVPGLAELATIRVMVNVPVAELGELVVYSVSVTPAGIAERLTTTAEADPCEPVTLNAN